MDGSSTSERESGDPSFGGGVPPPEESEVSSEHLLRRALVHDDHRAFTAVVGRLWPEMVGVAIGFVRSRADAEDAVQEAWLGALTGIEGFEGRSSLRTWLFRILTYRARSIAKRAQRTVPMSQIEPDDPGLEDRLDRAPLFLTSGVHPEDAVLAAELRDRVESALSQIPDRQRRVLRLRAFEGWSSKEVRERFDLSASNQRVLLHRARERVRDLVGR